MRALVFDAPREVRCADVPDPAVQDPRDALVRIELAGICGSDLHPYHGREVGLDRGTVLGHEFVGRVLEVGTEVERFAPGDDVLSPFTTNCGGCFYCARGLTCRCVEGQLFGWVEQGRGLHGAQAELVRVPLADATLVARPAGLSRDLGVLCGDVLSTGMACAAAGDVGPESLVAVVGCGPVGLMAAVAALELGARAVIAVDPVEERGALARALGAQHATPERALDTVRAVSDGRGADAVLEAVGSPGATRAAFALARPGATISAAGVHTEAQFAFSPGDAYDKNLTYRAGRAPARAFAERAVALALSARHPLERIVSHHLPLEEAPRGYHIFDEKLEGCTKVVLAP